ncbi:hypothetical protein B4Q13_16925 [Lacticaseibacillus rhamnosus]
MAPRIAAAHGKHVLVEKPVAATEELGNRWTKRVRVLGENLVLFRTEDGKLGLVDELCPHRRASLFYGIPIEGGIIFSTYASISTRIA